MHNYTKLFIDGIWQEPFGLERSDVINPATERSVGTVPLGNAEDVEHAVSAARRAFGPWSNMPSNVRASYIQALVDQLRQRADEIAALITLELGMPIQWCRSVQVDGPIDGLAQYVDLAGSMDEVTEIGNSLVIREPVGVCAFINPWNYPLHQLIGKLAPALAAGCTVVVKPSQETPLHAFLLAEIIEGIGLPSGVFNLVSGAGSVVGEALAAHADVDMVSFTGSTGAGVRVARSAAPSIKRVCLELGGKSALLIAQDADLVAAVRYGVQDVMINSGQTCTSLTRMLVPASRYREATELALAEVQSLQLGDPLDPMTFIGPMCSASQRKTVLDYIAIGQQEGALLLCGAEPLDGLDSGFYVRPTIFANVDNRMRIAQEEIFGPVLCMIPYATEAEAIEIANDSPFGLSSGVWAGSRERGLSLARQIRAGQCFVNGAAFNYQAPFGGYKQSGNGREWGEAGLAEFVELKAIQI
jgi:aldehyde dehydrogenase (NAD+)